ncbi:hypothetical protein ACHAXA_007338 [Cyclostephanos tholiformis]|uniref:ABC transporter domain-containing protein n=1 Tax=Cyclostephanos tholiformis TaxID=382380 RepID=A0ABD3RW15_9STRA
MRLLFRNPVSILLALECANIASHWEVVDSFALPPRPTTTTTTTTTTITITTNMRWTSSTAIYAKPKRGGGGSGNNKARDAALAALDAMEKLGRFFSSMPTPTNVISKPSSAVITASSSSLDLLLESVEEPLTKKEMMELEKRRQKEARRAKAEAERNAAALREEDERDARKRALRALAEMDRRRWGGGDDDNNDGGGEGRAMSKKEAKMAAKKAEKEADKLARKTLERRARKLGITIEEMEEREKRGGGSVEINDHVHDGVVLDGANGSIDDGDDRAGEDDGGVEERGKSSTSHVTAEERIRKERPPPRIRIMESSQPDYTALRLEDVAITFRDQAVLKSATWGVQTGDRVGLVGANGAGKTTQLRILAGELEPTAGDVVKSHSDLRVAMLRQEFVDEIDMSRTLREEFMSVFEEEAGIMSELSRAEMELENMSSGADDNIADRMQEVLDRMAELQAKADAKGVNLLDSKVSKIMDLMGFDPEEGDYSVSMFSGGWKMRIGLGKVLLKDPNILLLDEPTNHLDLESVEWLEAFLRNQNIPMVIVSHDREFLDQVCTKIVDAEGGLCTEYQGNYSRFLQLKKARLDSWNAAYAAQEKRISEERSWINKFRLKQPQAVKQQVAEVKGLSHGYGNGANPLFVDSDLSIVKGDRIAVIGPNGAGKSTLLRVLMGKETPNEGSARIVGTNVYPAYFEQNQADVLDLDKTVLETVQAASNGQSYNELRALLGQFLFKGDAVEKKVENLSGGEKARLSLCCMMLRESNLLILDEPTNHLDIPAKEMLEEALQHFDGSVVVISHDRYFISKVATTIVAIEDKKLVKYMGDYKFYMEKSEAVRAKVEARYFEGGARIGAAPIVDLEELNKPKKKNFGGANIRTDPNKGIKNAKRQREKAIS